eukprot:7698840-Lingulodinium_polyedra.AAC.1
MKPDLEVHVLCENAGPTQERLQLTIGRALGMDAETTKQRIVKSQAGQKKNNNAPAADAAVHDAARRGRTAPKPR